MEFTLFPENVVCQDFMYLGNYSAEEGINLQFEVLMLTLDNLLCGYKQVIVAGVCIIAYKERLQAFKNLVLFFHFHLNCCYQYVVALVQTTLFQKYMNFYSFDEATKTFKVLFGLLPPT